MPLLASVRCPDFEIEDNVPSTIQSLIATLHPYDGLFGPYHPQTLAVSTRLAMAFWQFGDFNSAACVLARAGQDASPTLASEDPLRIEALAALSGLLFEQSNFEDAAAVQRELVCCRARQAGASDSEDSVSWYRSRRIDSTVCPLLKPRRDGFCLGVMFHDFFAHLAAPAGLLVATEWPRRIAIVVRIDTYRPGLDLPGHHVRDF